MANNITEVRKLVKKRNFVENVKPPSNVGPLSKNKSDKAN